MDTQLIKKGISKDFYRRGNQMSNIELYKHEQQEFLSEHTDQKTVKWCYVPATKSDILSKAYKLIDVKYEEMNLLIQLIIQRQNWVRKDQYAVINNFIKSLFGVGGE